MKYLGNLLIIQNQLFNYINDSYLLMRRENMNVWQWKTTVDELVIKIVLLVIFVIWMLLFRIV
jgi:hypothetical protein